MANRWMIILCLFNSSQDLLLLLSICACAALFSPPHHQTDQVTRLDSVSLQ